MNEDSRKFVPGPAGNRVMSAVRKLRIAAEMSYRELSERVAGAGRRIPELGLSRLEKGERRVDPDDLTALALALETTPNRLMLPEITRLTIAAQSELTPAVTGTPQRLWEWAQGERRISTPLDPIWEWDDDSEGRRDWEFLAGGKPYLLGDLVISGGGVPGITRSAADQDKLGDVVGAVRDALEHGLTPAEVRIAVELAISGSLLPPPED